jgi:MFS family permease
MGRNILAVIVGYIISVVIVIASFSAVYSVMGEDWAFKEGVYEVTMGWITVMILVGILAAIFAGIVCGHLSKHSKGAVLSLMALIFVLGGATFIMIMVTPKPTGDDLVRVPPTSLTDAPNKAQQPLWVAGLNPVIGAIGVMLGATLVCPKHGPKSSNGASDSSAE